MSRPRPVCTKARFTRSVALKNARKWGQRPYECEVCFGWHCSKQDRSERVHDGARAHLAENYFRSDE